MTSASARPASFHQPDLLPCAPVTLEGHFSNASQLAWALSLSVASISLIQQTPFKSHL